jgi:hypothetical protein
LKDVAAAESVMGSKGPLPLCGFGQSPALFLLILQRRSMGGQLAPAFGWG